MGFFSWKTQDTGRSIANKYSNRPTFRVVMTDDNGNRWIEEDYEGYGVFGGKDYYELLAEMNGYQSREKGIELEFSGDIYSAPNLSEDENWEWRNEVPQNCQSQGYFYDDDDDEEDYWLDNEEELEEDF